MGLAPRLCAAVAVAGSLASTGIAEARQYTYRVKVEAVASGDNFVPREGLSASGSLSANWTGTWSVNFVVDDAARTAQVGAAADMGLAEVSVTNSMSETASDGGDANYDYTCAFDDAEIKPYLTIGAARGSDPNFDYERGAVSLRVHNVFASDVWAQYRTIPCEGMPERYVGPSDLSIPGIWDLCDGPFSIPLSRLGEDHFVLQSDPGPIADCRDPLGYATYTGHTAYTLTLDSRPDLQIAKLSGAGELKMVRGEPHRVWHVRAQLTNTGGDLDVPSSVLLEGARVEDDTRSPPFRALGTASVPALKHGEAATVEWIAGASGPHEVNFDDFAEANLLRVSLDPDNAIAEASETNNARRLWRIACDAVSAPAFWLEVAEDGDDTRLAPPDYEAVLESVPANTPAEKTRAVLCYIQLEAQRRATLPRKSMRGTRFRHVLEHHFLKRYLKHPSPARGREAADEIGEPATRRLSLPIPPGLQRAFPHLPEKIYPASQFLADLRYNLGGRSRTRGTGKNHRFIRYIDGPSLVGPPNLRPGLDDDWAYGGRNHTNVMHWATGVNYADIGEHALRALFIGYELFHLEGWDVFGEDAINDLIGEDAGRLLGERLLLGSITRSNLTSALDADFREARAWVGSMLRLRRNEFDNLIVAEEAPLGSEHWVHDRLMGPWKHDSTIFQRFEGGDSVTRVRNSDFVDRLVQIYTLIYEGEEWQRKHGSPLTPLMRDIVKGVYDDQFRAQGGKGFWAPWDIEIKRK